MITQDQFTCGGIEMSASEIENFRLLWNSRIVGGAAADLRAADIHVTLGEDSPDIARVELPAEGAPGRCLFTILSQGPWRPLRLIDPAELDDVLLSVSAGIESAIEDITEGLSIAEQRERLQAIDAEVMALANSLDDRNPASQAPGWLPIPDDEPLLGFVAYLPDESAAA